MGCSGSCECSDIGIKKMAERLLEEYVEGLETGIKLFHETAINEISLLKLSVETERKVVKYLDSIRELAIKNLKHRKHELRSDSGKEK